MTQEEYKHLLLNPNWLHKRTQIVQRDGYKCYGCSNSRLIETREMAFLDLASQTSNICLAKTLPNFDYVEFYIDDLLFNQIRANVIVYFEFNATGRFSFIKSVRAMTQNENEEYIQKHLRLATDYYLREKFGKSFFNNQKIDENFSSVQDILDANPIKYILEQDVSNFKWLYSKGLNVHHKYYQDGKKPWEYPNEALITYCQDCHIELHENEKIQHLNTKGIKVGELTPCYRCGGSGVFPEYEHVQNGICFRCGGARYLEHIPVDFIPTDIDYREFFKRNV